MYDSASRRAVLATLGAAGVAGCLDGSSDSPGTTEDLEPPAAWRLEADGAVTTRPVVADGVVYAGDEAGTVTAVTETGTLEWQYDAGGPLREPLVVEGDRLVAVAGEDPQVGGSPTVHGVDLDTGDRRWTVDAPSGKYLDLVGTDDGAAFAVTGTDALSPTGETMYALDAADGEELWTADVGTPSFTAAVDDDGVYLRSVNRVYAVERADGEVRWHRDADRVHARPSVAGGVVVVAAVVDGTRSVLGLDAASGDARWRFTDWPATSLTSDAGTVYAGGRRVAAFNVETGDRRWGAEGPGYLAGATTDDAIFGGGDGVAGYERESGRRRFVADFDREIVVPRDANEDLVAVETSVSNERGKVELFGLDPASGDRLWAFDRGVPLTATRVGAEYAFVGTEDGHLYAVGD